MAFAARTAAVFVVGEGTGYLEPQVWRGSWYVAL